MPRPLLIGLCLAGFAAAATAQPVRPPPRDLPPAQAEVWPWPAADPKAWWDDKWPKLPEAADPLGERKLARGERFVPIDNGVDPPTYRLWGLMPLQWQVLKPDEMILEAWVRPARSVRQSVVRITVRRDGGVFVQGRAGYACCEPGVGRRIAFDAQLPAGQAQRFLALRSHPMWASPHDVRVAEAAAAETVCVDGVAYDLTLVVPGRARSLHRACDDAEVGEVADALEPVLQAALGRDPRFDVLYPGGVSFNLARSAYRELVEGGGRLKPDPQARPREPTPAEAPPPAAQR